nr:MAG TPA: glycophorin A membrane protein [Caudoviricetes sp.]
MLLFSLGIILGIIGTIMFLIFVVVKLFNLK